MVTSSDWSNFLTTVLKAQSHLLLSDLYNGQLASHGFRRALTLPSGCIAFQQASDSDVPGLPGHWQRGRLRLTSAGIWLEDDGFGWLYRFDEPDWIYYTEQWLPQMEISEDARRMELQIAVGDLEKELVDYERSRIQSLGLPSRLAQLRQSGPGLLERDDINCWIVQVGSRFCRPYLDQLVRPVELKDA